MYWMHDKKNHFWIKLRRIRHEGIRWKKRRTVVSNECIEWKDSSGKKEVDTIEKKNVIEKKTLVKLPM